MNRTPSRERTSLPGGVPATFATRGAVRRQNAYRNGARELDRGLRRIP
jgi:hypothetical protein